MSETADDVVDVTEDQPKAVVTTEPTKVQSPINLDEAGLMAPKDSAEEWRMAGLMLNSQALPKQFKNVPQVIMALQFLKQHKLPALIAIRQTTIINGTLSIWGELPLGLVQRSGHMEFFDEYLFDKDYNKLSVSNKNLDAEVYGALCVVKRKGFTATERPFTVEDAKKAGLWNKDIWKLYPKRMLQMRARSQALKDAFGDVLHGISIAEYDHNAFGPDEMKQLNVPTPEAVVEEINKAYGSSSQAQAN